MKQEECVYPQNMVVGGSAFFQQEFQAPHPDRVCPLTGDLRVEVIEKIPTSLLIDIYQRDLGLEITSEFSGVESLTLYRSSRSDLIFFYPPITGSPQFYKKLQTFHWYYPSDKFEYDRAKIWVQPGDRVLDIGCGPGCLASHIPYANYTGLEPQLASHLWTSDRHLNINPETLADHAMTHAGWYDVVCSFQVLEHVSDPAKFISMALACLKPGGILILGVPSADSYLFHLPNFVLNAPPHHVTWWTDQALRSLIARFELELLSLDHAPVEFWETRLYWMQRIVTPLSTPHGKHFTSSLRQRYVNIGAYLSAGLLEMFTAPNQEARGASVVVSARKRW